MTLTQKLVELIRRKRIDEEDYRYASLLTLDAVANSIAGRNTVPGKLLRKWDGVSSVDAGRRAFAMGALAHILECDDLHRSSASHPGCVVVPAALSLGARYQTEGKKLLDAILHGFEAMCRVGNSVGRKHYETWHNTATCGPFGSAMAAASILGLSDEQAVHALGNAGTQSAGLWEFLETGAMSKHLHAGRAAEAGILAAELASLGFTGPPGILEGKKGFYAATCPDAHPEKVIEEFDAAWQLRQTSIKPWPCCRHTHAAIDAALDLRTRLGSRTIKHVSVDVYQASLDICDRPMPQSEYEAKFSIQHCIAAALTTGKVEFDSFDEANRARQSELRKKFSVQVAEPFQSAYPNEYWGARVAVLTTDGERIEITRKYCKGDPEAFLTDGEIRDKAACLMRIGGLDGKEIEDITDAVMRLRANQAEWRVLAKVIPKTDCKLNKRQDVAVGGEESAKH